MSHPMLSRIIAHYHLDDLDSAYNTQTGCTVLYLAARDDSYSEYPMTVVTVSQPRKALSIGITD